MIGLSNFSPIIDNNNLFPGVDVTVLPGEVLCIMGYSGCGKTSFFRALQNQLLYAGQVELAVDQVFNVFQTDQQLFPWITIEENLELVCNSPWDKLVQDWKLESLIHKMPMQLSVGQRQRFTLIRALCSGRNILLCDEPLSAVDGITSIDILRDFKKIVLEKNICCLWITHSVTEAQLIADKVLVLNTHSTTMLDKDINHETIFKLF